MNTKLPPIRLVLLCAILLVFFATGCVSRVSLNPSVPQSVRPARLGDQVAVYISPIYQRQIHTQTIEGPGTLDIELGPAILSGTRQALQPFFDIVMVLGPGETSSLPYRIDIRNERFYIEDDLGANVTIWCKVMREGKVLLDQGFDGRGPGSGDPGFKQLGSAREEVQRAGETAFQDAFTKMQKTFAEKVVPR